MTIGKLMIRFHCCNCYKLSPTGNNIQLIFGIATAVFEWSIGLGIYWLKNEE